MTTATPLMIRTELHDDHGRLVAHAVQAQAVIAG